MARAAVSGRVRRLERGRGQRGCPACGPGAPVVFRPIVDDLGDRPTDEVPPRPCPRCGRVKASPRFPPLRFDVVGIHER